MNDGTCGGPHFGRDVLSAGAVSDNEDGFVGVVWMSVVYGVGCFSCTKPLGKTWDVGVSGDAVVPVADKDEVERESF